MARYVLVSAAAAKTKVQEKTQKRKFNSCYFFRYKILLLFQWDVKLFVEKFKKANVIVFSEKQLFHEANFLSCWSFQIYFLFLLLVVF